MAKFLGRLTGAQLADKKTAQQQMANWAPRFPHLVCFDMDGHLLDSMTAKQVVVFHPVFMDRFDLRAIESFYRLHAENHNLWTEDRGCDRHEAKLHTVRSLPQDPHLAPLLAGDLQQVGAKLASLEASLAGYVDWKAKTGKAYSYDSLFEFAKLNPDDDNLHHLTEWSFCCDHEFRYVTIPMKPFPGVREALEHLADKADVLIVSKTPYNDICNWLETQNLIRLVSAVAGKEMGDKDEHICITKGGVYDVAKLKGEQVVERGGRYADDKVIMGGDGNGDLKAAKANGAYFFGTIPGKETEAWSTALELVFNPFLAGAYAESEPQLIQAFKNGMKPKGFWTTEEYKQPDGHIKEYEKLDAARQELYATCKPGGRLLTAAEL